MCFVVARNNKKDLKLLNHNKRKQSELPKAQFASRWIGELCMLKLLENCISHFARKLFEVN